MTTLARIEAEAAACQLEIMGGLSEHQSLPPGTATLLLLGPLEPGFWPVFQASPEAQDGRPDPLDRWSARVIGALAERLNAQALFPFGGPPYQPFIQWAQASGRAWSSPVSLLVHDRAGLMISYRGALAFPNAIPLPAPATNPCTPCAQPCRSACPVNALTPEGYDVATCKTHITRPEGQACRTKGCLVRRACPVSQSYGRQPEQSGFHMEAFLG